MSCCQQSILKFIKLMKSFKADKGVLYESFRSMSIGRSTNNFGSLLQEENKIRTKRLLASAGVNKTFTEVMKHPENTYAAILVPLCTVKGEPSLLFTLRSFQLKAHKGYVSFPGGNVDETDEDFTFTALRETHEELGIEPGSFDVWGEMSPQPGTVDGKKKVYPVVANLKGGDLDISALRLNPKEVEKVFTIPIRQLCEPTNTGSTRFRGGDHGMPFTLPVYLCGNHRLWGLTSVVTHSLLKVLAPTLYTFRLKHRPQLIHAPVSKSNIRHVERKTSGKGNDASDTLFSNW